VNVSEHNSGFFTLKVLLLVLFLYLPTQLIAQSSYYTRDDFERESLDLTGSFWSSLSLFGASTMEITSERQYSGNKSLKISMSDSNGAELTKDLTAAPPSELTFSFRYRTDGTLLYGSTPLHFLRLRDENGNVCARFYHHPDNDWFQFDYIDGNGDWQLGVGTMERALFVDKWNTIRITFKTGASAEISWSLNGRPIWTETTTTQAAGIGYINFGHSGTSENSTGDVYFDDVRYSDNLAEIDQLDRGRVSFTYDDGDISNWTVLKPILDEYGIRASFYAVTDYQEWPKEYAMSADNLLTLDAEGHDIQSHTAGHEDLTAITPEELAYQLGHSKAYLESIGLTVDILTLPFGRYNDDVIQAAKDAGYSAVFTTLFGFNGKSNLDAPWRIMRLDAAMFTSEEIKNWMDLAAQEKLWLVLYYHAVEAESPAASINGEEGKNFGGGEDYPFTYEEIPGQNKYDDQTNSSRGIITSDEDEYPYTVSESHMREVFEHALNNGYDVVTADKILSYPDTNGAPVGSSASPTDSSGDKDTFSFTFSEPDGHSDFEELYILLNNSQSNSSAVYLKYSVSEDMLYLRDDDDTSWGTGYTPGAINILNNSQVTIDCSTASYSTNTDNGQEVSLTLDLNFRAAFVGDKDFYLRAVDVHGASGGFSQHGSYTVEAGSGSIQVTITPQEAIDAGAQWSNDVDATLRDSGTVLAGLTAESDITVSGTDLDEWITPASQIIAIVKDVTTPAILEYVKKPLLTITFTPEVAISENFKWSIDGGKSWHFSGESLYVSPGNHTVMLNHNSSYSLSSWSGDATGNDSPLTISISEDTSLNAEFVRATGQLDVTLNQNGSNGSYSISGPEDFNGGNDLTGVTSNFSSQVPTGNYTVTAVNQPEYGLSVSGNNGFSSGVSSSSGTVISGHSFSISVDYSHHSYTLTVVSKEGGKTDMDGSSSHSHGELVSIEASGEPGYAFSNWSCDSSGTDNPLLIAVTGDMTVEANYATAVQTVGVTTAKSEDNAYTFVATFRDGDGHDDLRVLEMLINDSPQFEDGIYLRYRAAPDLLFLRDSENKTWIDSKRVGTEAVLENDLVEIDMKGVRAVMGSNPMEKNFIVPVVFKNGFSGSRNIYLNASDATTWSGWSDSLFNFSINSRQHINRKPVNVSAQTEGRRGSSTDITCYWKDADGASNLSILELIIANPFEKTSSVYLQYDVNSNTVSMRNDEHSAWTSGTPGETELLENTQAIIDLSDVEIETGSLDMRLTLSVIFKTAYVGKKNIYMRATDILDASSEWEEKDRFVVSGKNHPPVNKCVLPANGSGTSFETTLQYKDIDGFDDLDFVEFILADTTVGSDTVWLRYDLLENKVYLRDDANSQWIGAQVGSDVTIANSQVTVDLSQISVNTLETELEVELEFDLSNSYTGTHNLWLSCTDNSGDFDDWQDFGDWTVSTAEENQMRNNNAVQYKSFSTDSLNNGSFSIIRSNLRNQIIEWSADSKTLLRKQESGLIPVPCKDGNTFYLSGKINPGLSLLLSEDKQAGRKVLLQLSERANDNQWIWNYVEIIQGYRYLIQSWSQEPLDSTSLLQLHLSKGSMVEIESVDEKITIELPSLIGISLDSQVNWLDIVKAVPNQQP
jgi:hypothetical protein